MPLKSASAQAAVEAIHSLKWGFSKVHTDAGKQFDSYTFRNEMGELHAATPKNHKGNGLVERRIREVRAILSRLGYQANTNDWLPLLHLVRYLTG